MAKKESFEQAMARLEEIVAALESGEATLDESMKLLEEGTRLSAQCADKLEKARHHADRAGFGGRKNGRSLRKDGKIP